MQPNLNKGVAMDWKQGGNAVPGELGNDGFFAEQELRKDHHLQPRLARHARVPERQEDDRAAEGRLQRAEGRLAVRRTSTISTTLFDKYTPRPPDLMVLDRTRRAASPTRTRRTLERRGQGFADAKVQTRDEFKANFEAPINKLLNLLYALLALSVIVSLVGIINTLVLTVFERTRELGMLRAVGMTRRQVRMMIRYESIVTALMGAALGMVVGVFLRAARHACALEPRDRVRGALDRSSSTS